jgi:hypothetical protein
MSLCQEFGVHASKIFTNNYELENSFGAGIITSIQFKNIKFTLNYSYYQNEREFYGNITCGFIIPESFRKETVISLSNAHSLDISIALGIYGNDYFDPFLGIGFAINNFFCKKGCVGNQANDSL